MQQMMAAYNEGTLHFLSTSNLTVEDWTIERLLTRHKKVVEAIALRFNLPTGSLAQHLPQLSTNDKGEEELEHTEKWQ